MKLQQIKTTFFVVLLIITALCFFLFLPHHRQTGLPALAELANRFAAQEKAERKAQEELLPNDMDSILVDSESVPLDTIPESITVLVNRSYLLPSSYVPAHLTEPKVPFSFDYKSEKRRMRREAARALEKMFRDAKKKKNIVLYGVSGYRSYQRQREIYLRNVALRGRAATDAVSATPGSSEHQTGLTIDISAKSVDCALIAAFGKTREGRWVAKNAHKYGFIVRYPAGKSKITGYHYEPWHIRYVGKETAAYLYKNDLTLEEYYGIRNTSSKRK